MNNKGFTLIELLATIVILGVLSTIAVVSVGKYITKSKNFSIEKESQSIYQAAETCLMETGIKDGDRYRGDDSCVVGGTVHISTLIEKGYLEKTNCDPDGTVKIINSGHNVYGIHKYTYEVSIVCDGVEDTTEWPKVED